MQPLCVILQSGNEWGFRAVITAPVSEASVNALVRAGWPGLGAIAASGVAESSATAAPLEVDDADLDALSPAMAERALATCLNDVAAAAALLARDREALVAGARADAVRRASGGPGAAAATQQQASLSESFRSTNGMYTIAIGAGVLVRGRPPVQLPSAISSHADYGDAMVSGTAARAALHLALAASGSGAPAASDDDADAAGGAAAGGQPAIARGAEADLCTVVAVNSCRRWVQVTAHNTVYDLVYWQPLAGDSEALLPEEAAALGDAGSAAWREADDAYISHGMPRWVRPKSAGTPSDLAGAAPTSRLESQAAGALAAILGPERAGQVLAYDGALYSRVYVPGSGVGGPAGTLFDAALRSAVGWSRDASGQTTAADDPSLPSLGPVPTSATASIVPFCFSRDMASGAPGMPVSLLLWLPAPEASLIGVATRSSDNTAPPPLLGRLFEAVLSGCDDGGAQSPFVEVYGEKLKATELGVPLPAYFARPPPPTPPPLTLSHRVH